MKLIKTIWYSLVFVLLLIFAVQNNNAVAIKFLTFSVSGVPLFVVIICVFVLGFISGQIMGWISRMFSSNIDAAKK